MSSTILVLVSLLVGKAMLHVSYDFDGTMEDCITTIQLRITYDIVRNDPSIINKYFCVPIKEVHVLKDEEA